LTVGLSELVIGNNHQYKLAWQLLVSAYIGKFNGDIFFNFFFLPAALRVIVLSNAVGFHVGQIFSIFIDSYVVGGEHS
jgi:hypothetical protein